MSHLKAAIIIKILKPLVSLLIKHNVAHSEFSEIAKQAYVDIARQEFGLPNKKMTSSRVAILTGLSRKEVVRLSGKSETAPEPSIKPNRAARVITGWISDNDFLNEDKSTKDLPLKGEISFTQLVERYSGDITAGAILDELLANKIVIINEDQKIHLEKAGFIPDSNEIEKISILAECTKDLLNTGVHNINKDLHSPPRFQRQFVQFDIPKSLNKEFSQLCEKKSLALLLELNEWFKLHHLTPHSSEQKVLRTGLGIYYFEDHEND